MTRYANRFPALDPRFGMSDASYFWHDYETFGANPRYDRPAQFAGQRTTFDLEPIGEPVVEYCQPIEDYLPEPEACLITGITPQQAQARGWPEPEFIRRVLAELGRPGTCGVGYNSLRFDDEVTRHTAWRNFFDPYAREWQNGCSRWDIIDMARLTYALRPEGIEWPRREDGNPSFRLEDLAAANGLEQSRAHDALSDVQATIALARLIRERQPKLYDFVVANRDKRSAASLLDLTAHTPVVHVSARFPASQGCLSLVMPLVAHPVNRNAVIVYDLRADPAELLSLDAEDIRERLFTPRADLPEDVERVALKAVHINRCPVLAPAATLSEAQAQRLGLDLAACRRHWQSLKESIAALAPRVAEVFARGEPFTTADPEQDLYAGFLADGDRRLADRVRAMGVEELVEPDLSFSDPRLPELLFRYRARHFPDALSDPERDEWARHLSRRLEYAADGGLSLDDYFARLEALRREHAGDADRLGVLDALEAWGRELRGRL